MASIGLLSKVEYLQQKLLEILTKCLTSWPLTDIVMKQWMVLSCKQIKVYNCLVYEKKIRTSFPMKNRKMKSNTELPSYTILILQSHKNQMQNIIKIT